MRVGPAQPFSIRHKIISAVLYGLVRNGAQAARPSCRTDPSLSARLPLLLEPASARFERRRTRHYDLRVFREATQLGAKGRTGDWHQPLSADSAMQHLNSRSLIYGGAVDVFFCRATFSAAQPPVPAQHDGFTLNEVEDILNTLETASVRSARGLAIIWQSLG
jgi:hypothetical protein